MGLVAKLPWVLFTNIYGLSGPQAGVHLLGYVTSRAGEEFSGSLFLSSVDSRSPCKLWPLSLVVWRYVPWTCLQFSVSQWQYEGGPDWLRLHPPWEAFEIPHSESRTCVLCCLSVNCEADSSDMCACMPYIADS